MYHSNFLILWRYEIATKTTFAAVLPSCSHLLMPVYSHCLLLQLVHVRHLTSTPRRILHLQRQLH
ncbi:hypothetical protein BDR06DRAFT_592903 [Suillus hirtellus]|nr:hypothetical protein BDR06DRAFT_592903 [Suillus hirtellus]